QLKNLWDALLYSFVRMVGGYVRRLFKRSTTKMQRITGTSSCYARLAIKVLKRFSLTKRSVTLLKNKTSKKPILKRYGPSRKLLATLDLINLQIRNGWDLDLMSGFCGKTTLSLMNL